MALHRFDIQSALPIQPEPPDIVDQVISSVTAQIKSLLGAGKPPIIGLTVGVDSRIILACTRAWAGNLTFVTMTSDGARDNDARIARHFAQELQLRYANSAAPIRQPSGKRTLQSPLWSLLCR